MTARRILFIDDDEGIIRVLNKYFESRGYQTFSALTGREGIKTFHRVSPDVTVLDLHMPDISGLNVLEELRPKRPMVIMLTGDSEIENAVEAMRHGAENFLTKPIELPHLEAAVEKAAEKASLNRENIELRSRITPSFKRKVMTAILFTLMVAASVALGSFIGGGRPGPEGAPIPVPLNPQDTVLEVDDAPFRPVPRPPDRGQGRS